MSTIEIDQENGDLYSVLDVPHDTSEAAIRAAIEAAREQANRLSKIPKRRAEAEARLAQLEQAERVLLDPKARVAYDTRFASEPNTVPQPEPSQAPTVDTDLKASRDPARQEHCRSCGAELVPNANFCDECGTPIQPSPSADPVRVVEASNQAVPSQAPSAPPPRNLTPSSTPTNQTRGHIWLPALVIVLIASVVGVFLYLHRMKVASPAPAAPVNQPVNGQVADLRPPQASLLNHPVLQPSTTAIQNQQNIHGIVTLKSDNSALSIVYPGGAEYRLSDGLYKASGPASAAFNSDYGTIVISSNGFAAERGTSSTWQVQFDADQAKDINGDGFPEVVLSDFSGGAHCCTTVAVLSLRSQGAYLVFEQGLGSAEVEFRDVDGDGRREILFHSLAEYALGSFAQGTYGVSVIYSAGGDGVYRINTRAYQQILAHEYQTAVNDYAKAKYDPDGGNMEEDRDLIDLFFSAYLTGNRTDAYSYLGRLKPLTSDISAKQDPLAILENTLKQIAPEVLEEPEWISLRSGKQEGATPQSAEVPGLQQQSPNGAQSIADRSTPSGRDLPCSSADDCYTRGLKYDQGSPPSHTLAALYFSKACDASNADACLMLGADYVGGVGVAMDRAKAQQLFAKACSLGRTSACNNQPAAPTQKTTPSSGTLHYAGPPVEYGQIITFRGLPNGRLRFTFDHDAWQPFISRQSDGTQMLTLRSLKRTAQTECDVQWSVITN